MYVVLITLAIVLLVHLESFLFPFQKCLVKPEFDMLYHRVLFFALCHVLVLIYPMLNLC